MTDDEPLPIPGLDMPERISELERQVRATVQVLQGEGLVLPRHAARIQLAIELAQIVEFKRRSGKVSTVGNDARVLMELLDKLLPDEEGIDAELRKTMEEWSEVIRRELGGDPVEVRDPSGP